MFLIPCISDARSGCCSHHGGVCGCGCCDGTSLSATCAPYYPQCSSPVARTIDIPSVKPVDDQPADQDYTPDPLYIPKDQEPESSNGNIALGTILGLGAGGSIVYLALRKKKNLSNDQKK